jgi:hypothetical protein
MCGIVAYIGDEKAGPILFILSKGWSTGDMILQESPSSQEAR